MPANFCPPCFLVAWCLWSSVSVRGDVVLRRNGYTGVNIALSPRVSPEGLPDEFAETIAQLVDSASKKIYQELGGRAFFEEVTLLVPSSVNASAIAGSVAAVSSRPSFGSAHFWIEADEGCVFGANPYTLQYGSCGVRGLRTMLPLSHAVQTKGDAMARQWYRLRYGVFCEQPLQDDPTQSPEVAAALKHAILCGSRKPLDVILQSDDFRGVNLSRESSFKRVRLNVVQEAALRVVVVWNVEAKGVAERAPYATTLRALQKFAQVMAPEGANVALVAYSPDLFVADSKLIPLESKGQRERFAKSYPPRHQGEAVNFQGAIVKALELLTPEEGKQTAPHGTILIVSHNEIPLADINAARQKLDTADVRVHALLLSASGAASNVGQLCADYGGNALLAEASKSKALYYTHQANAIAKLVFSKTSYAETKAPILLKQKIIDPLRQAEEVRETFYVDSLLSATLRVMIVYETFEEIVEVVNSLKLSAPDGKVYDVSSEEFTEEPFNIQQFKLINASAGQWTLQLAGATSETVKLEVWLQPAVITDPPVFVSVWLSSPSSSVDPSKPFLVYAEIRKGSKPVRDVIVTATVVDPEGKHTVFHLVDTGTGYPDITAGDGIYSRYFTGFSKKGLYQLSVTAEGSDKSMVVGNTAGNDLESASGQCCGWQFPNSGSVPSGPFSRYLEYGSFFSLQDKPLGDIYPPSRIADLKVTHVDLESRRVSLEWSAPGGDYDQGTATGYQIKYFDSPLEFEALYERSGKEIDSFSIDGLANSPKPFGDREEATVSNFKCGDGGGSCYFAVRASDGTNYGPVSNVVEVRFPTPTPAPLEPEGKLNESGIVVDGDRNYARGGLTSLQLALAIVLPLLFLLLLIVVIAVIVCFRRRRESKEPPPTRDRPTISSPTAKAPSAPPGRDEDDSASPYATSLYNGGSSISPVNSYSADYLMDRYEEKAKVDDRARNGNLSSPPAGTRQQQQVWTTPQGRNSCDGLPAVRPYVTTLKPVRSPPSSSGGRELPPGFSTEPRRQTFV